MRGKLPLLLELRRSGERLALKSHPTTGAFPTKCFPRDWSDLLDGLKQRACGCFVGGMRRAVRAKEPALVESGAVYVYNYHMPVRQRANPWGKG